MRIAVMLALSLLVHWHFFADAPAPQTQRLSGGLQAPVGLTLVTLNAPASPALQPAQPERQAEPKPEPVVKTEVNKVVEKVVQETAKKTAKVVKKREVTRTPDSPPSAASSVQSTPKPSQQAGLAKEAALIDEPLFRQPPTPPHYPKQARRRNRQGVAEVLAWLDVKGDVTRTELVRSSGYPELDRAARQAVAGWLFQPLKENGVAMPARVQVPVRFFLH